MNFSTKVFYHIILSFISPVLGLLVLFKSKSKKFITFAGTLFMGLVGSVFIYNPNTDGQSHLEKVYLYYLNMNFSDFAYYAYDLLLLRPTPVGNDLYKHVLSYLAGGIFGVPELIHLFAGLILGYFYTKSVLLIIEDHPKHRTSLLLFALLAMFLIIRSITALNSIRMWTGMWVFFYGAYAFIKQGNKKYLLVLLFSLLIHFSYIIYIIPLAGAFILRKSKKIVSLIYLLSLFLSVDYQTFVDFAPQDNELYQIKSGYILSERRLEERAEVLEGREKGNFYAEYGRLIYKNYSIPFLSFILLYLYNFKRNKEHLNFLMAGGFLLLALSNISEFSPSIAGRGNALAATFLTAALIIFTYSFYSYSFSTFTKRLVKSGTWLFFISSIPYLLFHIAYALNISSIFIFVAPVASWFIGDQDLSIRDAIMLFL